MIRQTAFILAAVLFFFFQTLRAEAIDLLPSKNSSAALILNAQARYQHATLVTGGGNPNYSGFLYTGSLDYLIGTRSFAIGPSVSYTLGSLENTANTTSRIEELEHRVLTAGLKAYYGNLYLGASYAIFNLDSKTTTTSTTSIELKGKGFQAELGFAFTLSRSFLLSIGGTISKTSFPKSANSSQGNTDYLNYGGAVGLGFLLPSSGGGDSYYDDDNFAPPPSR